MLYWIVIRIALWDQDQKNQEGQRLGEHLVRQILQEANNEQQVSLYVYNPKPVALKFLKKAGVAT